jgi:hypothetical protein
MIEVIASGPPGSGIVELRVAGNEAVVFKFLEGT